MLNRFKHFSLLQIDAHVEAKLSVYLVTAVNNPDKRSDINHSPRRRRILSRRFFIPRITPANSDEIPRRDNLFQLGTIKNHGEKLRAAETFHRNVFDRIDVVVSTAAARARLGSSFVSLSREFLSAEGRIRANFVVGLMITSRITCHYVYYRLSRISSVGFRCCSCREREREGKRKRGGRVVSIRAYISAEYTFGWMEA